MLESDFLYGTFLLYFLYVTLISLMFCDGVI